MVFNAVKSIGVKDRPVVHHDVKFETARVVLFRAQIFEDSEENPAHEIKSEAVLHLVDDRLRVLVVGLVQLLQTELNHVQKCVHVRRRGEVKP